MIEDVDGGGRSGDGVVQVDIYVPSALTAILICLRARRLRVVQYAS